MFTKVMDDGGGETGSEVEHKVARFHFLDWLRASLIICVVYAHLARMGVADGITGEVQIDDHTYIGEDPSPVGTRWVSIIRQWCLPVLFWVSGAAMALSYHSISRGLLKLFAYTALGIGLNALLWFLGPQDGRCDPRSSAKSSDCKGLLFDFTVCPWSGSIFPLVFQMWYTGLLMALMVLNRPLFGALSGTLRPLFVLLQWAVTSSIYVGLALRSGFLVPNPPVLIVLLLSYEAAFFVMVLLTIPRFKPNWVPLRVLHYLAAFIVVQQFAATPVVNSMNTISSAFMLFCFVGFNKFYQLGYVMMRARCGKQPDDVRPLLSGWWPLAPVVLAVLAPSSNWFIAGNLTYPYFPRLEDRWLYVAGATVTLFTLDRCDRNFPTKPLPRAVGNAALLLYLFHPTLLTVLIAIFPAWMRSVPCLWLATVLVTALVVSILAHTRTWRHSGGADVGSDEEEASWQE